MMFFKSKIRWKMESKSEKIQDKKTILVSHQALEPIKPKF